MTGIHKKDSQQTIWCMTQKNGLFSGYTVYNGDFTTKKKIYMSATKLVSHEIESWYLLEADQLVESYKKGELTGKLKRNCCNIE